MEPLFDNLVITGTSRGIGEAVAHHLAPRTTRLLGVSRSPSQVGEWVQADLSNRDSIHAVQGAIANNPLDALLYLGGTWETHAFTPDYTFDQCNDADLETVLQVNLLAPIRLVQALLPNLRQANNPKVVFMGSVSGLDNFPGREVANTASKFGLRGVVHALREELRRDRIAVTIINPGDVATSEVLEDLRTAGKPATHAIPLTDLCTVIDCVLSLSRSTCIKEIQLPAMQGTGA